MIGSSTIGSRLKLIDVFNVSAKCLYILKWIEKIKKKNSFFEKLFIKTKKMIKIPKKTIQGF